jgi:hypothetical protein
MWMTEELFVTEIADFRHIFPSYWWRRLSFVSSVANSKFPRDQGQQQQQPQLQNAMSPTAEESLRPAPPPPTTNSNLPPNSQNSNAATNNLGKYDENLLFQLQRAPPSSTLGSTLSRAVSNVHVREDSLIDLNEDKSYMRQSQPEPPPESASSRPVYSNDQHHQQSTTQQLEAYQRLQVSDQTQEVSTLFNGINKITITYYFQLILKKLDLYRF